MELTVTGLSVGENNDLVMLGKMGVWEAKIYFGPSDGVRDETAVHAGQETVNRSRKPRGLRAPQMS